MSEPCLRADAARNRRLLVAAAREVFGERGLDAPLDEIARRAGVGNATLYRRFPTRSDLINAVFTDALREIVTAVDYALVAADPWDAFAGHVTFLCELQAGNRALADLLTLPVRGAPEFEELRTRAFDGLVELIGRAQASGDLRADFEATDVVLVLMANAGLVDRTAAAAPEAWRRHLAFLLDGLRTGDRAGGRAQAVPDACPAAVRDAMAGLADRLGC